jgi:branched-chain amino acid transport system substrate-binding protein
MRPWLAILAALCLLTAACAPAAGPAGGGAAPAAQPAPAGGAAPPAAAPQGQELVIGGSMALTGPFAEPGRWYQRVWEWYFKDLNARGGLLGRPVKLVLYDDESDPNKAATLCERLLTVDKVDLLIGPYPTPTLAAVIPIAERNGMVLVQGGTAASSLLRGHNNRYTFTIFTALDTDTGRIWIDWLNSLPAAQRPKSAALFVLNNPYTIGIQKGLQEQLAAAGVTVVLNEVYDQSTSDFTALVQKAKAANAEAVALLSYFPDSVLITRTMSEQAYKPKTTFNAISSTLPTWTAELKELGEYATSPVQVWQTFPYKDADRLSKMLQDEFKVSFVPAHAGWSMTVAQALHAAVEGCGKIDQDCTADWLRSNPVDSVSGKIKFDREGVPEYFHALTQVLNGQVTVVWPRDLATAQAVYPIP